MAVRIHYRGPSRGAFLLLRALDDEGFTATFEGDPPVERRGAGPAFTEAVAAVIVLLGYKFGAAAASGAGDEFGREAARRAIAKFNERTGHRAEVELEEGSSKTENGKSGQ